ncbi:MAG: hypothetical protein KOO65_13380 [Desulfobacterales bacterium]|nr:hypothetical protein [Desulfobacterales bacterium]
MKEKCNIRSVINIVFVVLLAFFISGCFGLGSSQKPEGKTSADQPKSRKTTAVYYDFEDVLIPMELSIVKNRTVVILTPGFTSGLITLKGRVERQSLFNFFNNNMLKDNWNVISQIKSPGTTIMVFQKPSRTSVITIRDEQIYTYVEVGVAPTITGGSGFSRSNLIE